MTRFKRLSVLLLTLVLAPVAVVTAQGGFDWVPLGGQELLLQVVGQGADGEDLGTILQSKRSANEWSAYFERVAPQWKALSAPEQQTLAEYLALNLPIPDPKIPRDPQKADPSTFLPFDGRELLLRDCQLCHSLGATVEKEKSAVAWEELLNNPVHWDVSKQWSENQRLTFASYCAINLPIPDDVIPPEVRQPLPGY